MAEKEKQKCARCGYETEDRDKYCIRCGAPMLNTCTHKGDLFTKGCTKVNKPDAAYCSSCGAKTSFHEAGIVKPHQ